MRSSKSIAIQKVIFIAKLLLGVLPLFAFYCFARFCTDGYMDGEWPRYYQVKQYINNRNQYNDFLIMGDSTAKFNLNADSLSSADCYVQNIALGGTAPLENYYSLKTYLRNNNKVNTIIIVFTPLHYCKIPHFTSRTEFFHEYSLLDMIDCYKTALNFKNDKTVSETFFSTFIPIIKILKAYIFYPPLYLPAMNNSRFINRYKTNTDLIAFYNKTKGSHFCGNNTNPQFQSLVYLSGESFYEQKIQTYYMAKFLKLCKQNKINVIIENSPFPFVAQNIIQKNFENEFFAYLQSFKTNFKDIIIQKNFTYYDNAYFIDGAHLNNNGNAAWTEHIKETYINPYIVKKLKEEKNERKN